MSNSKPIFTERAGPPANAVANIPRSEEERQREITIERLKAAYVRERRRWLQANRGFEGRDDLNPYWDTAWPRAADFVITHGCDPDTYIHAQFNRGRFVTPKQLWTPKALEAYRKFVQESEGIIADRLAAETRVFEARLFEYQPFLQGRTKEEQWRFLLNDTTLALTPLFRYCVAASCSFHPIMDQYEEQALYQYLGNRQAYDMHWSAVIPPRLRERARQYLA